MDPMLYLGAVDWPSIRGARCPPAPGCIKMSTCQDRPGVAGIQAPGRSPAETLRALAAVIAGTS